MVKVVSVRFRTGGRAYYFDPLEFEIVRGQHVIVETARGIEYGEVVSNICEIDEEHVVAPLKPVIRVATDEDAAIQESNLKKKDEAYAVCLEKIKKHGLEMKLVDAEYTFDNNKLLFYFTADGRIDFRELVKDLAAVFKTRIELRQIGVRDEIKLMGGIGVCGRVLCCHSFLPEFAPVSIKMAKEQNLSLNPTKISGVCGRLMCCLKNEEETYEELNRKLPGVGDYVTASDGLRGEVHSVNVLRQLVKVLVDVGDEREIKEYPASELQFKKMYHKNKEDLTPEEKEALELLERQEMEDAKAKEENSNAAKKEKAAKEEKGKDRGGKQQGDSKTPADNRNGKGGKDRTDRRGDRKGDRGNKGQGGHQGHGNDNNNNNNNNNNNKAQNHSRHFRHGKKEGKNNQNGES